MPISSGAGGKITGGGGRLVVASGGNRRIYWPHSSAPTAELASASFSTSTVNLYAAPRRESTKSQELGPSSSATAATKARRETPLKTFKKIASSNKRDEPKIASQSPVSSSKLASKRLKQLEECQLSISSEEGQESTLMASMNSLGGQLIVTGNQSQFAPREQQHNSKQTTGGNLSMEDGNKKLSLSSLIASQSTTSGPSKQTKPNKVAISSSSSSTAISSGSKPSYLISNASIVAAQQSQLQHNLAAKQPSLNPSFNLGLASTSSSTAQLTSALNGRQQQQHRQFSNSGSQLNINKRVNLKYVKTLIILLMAVDLLITVFVHQFAQQDNISLIFLSSYKLRFSLLNLILSSIWFVLLIGAILFDVYFLLLIGSLVDILSFVLLLVFSIIHFTHRIDYNSVNLTSLLLLLFSITILHVYLLVMAALTTYLMIAVKHRRRPMR